MKGLHTKEDNTERFRSRVVKYYFGRLMDKEEAERSHWHALVTLTP